MIRFRTVVAATIAIAWACAAHAAQSTAPKKEVPQPVRIFVANTYWSVARCATSQPSLSTRLNSAVAALKSDNAALVPADAWSTATLDQATLDRYNANSPQATESLCAELATRLEGEKFRAAFKTYIEALYKSSP